MRSDYKDIAVNCAHNATEGARLERRQSRKKFKDREDAPNFEKIGYHYNTYDKYDRVTERLKPIWRMIRKNCGRPWADVWSEICAIADNRSIRGYNLRERIRNFVGTIADCERYHYGSDSWSRYECIVDENGILIRNPRYGEGWGKKKRVGKDATDAFNKEQLRKQKELDVRNEELAIIALKDKANMNKMKKMWKKFRKRLKTLKNSEI